MKIIKGIGISALFSLMAYAAIANRYVLHTDDPRIADIRSHTAAQAHKAYVEIESLPDTVFFTKVSHLPKPMCYSRSRAELYYFLFDSASVRKSLIP